MARYKDHSAKLEASLTPGERELYDAIGESFAIERELASLRRNTGLSQTALAALSGVPQPEISRIEAGKTVPSFNRVKRLVHSMGGRIDIVAPAPAPAQARAARADQAAARRA